MTPLTLALLSTYLLGKSSNDENQSGVCISPHNPESLEASGQKDVWHKIRSNGCHLELPETFEVNTLDF